VGPQADLTFISGLVYELDVNAFRLALKDIEDSEEGMAFQDMHRHSPPFTFGTTTLARVVEIINGFTITFEDTGSPYAVRLTQANTNIDEATNVNNVSVRSNNTAGLVLSDVPITAENFKQLVGAVYIDTVNGVAGTAEGVGLPGNPVNNITDARTIADRDKLSVYKFAGPLTINADHPNWVFEGISSVAHDELDLNGFDLGSSKIIGAKCTGTLTGQKQQFFGCDMNGVGGLNGLIELCWLRGSLSGQASGEVIFKDCGSAVPGTASPIYTLSANEQFNQRNYSGGWEFRNSTAGNTSTIEVDPGNIILPASNTGGTIVIRGVGTFTDNTAGATVNSDGFVDSVGLSDMIVNGVDLKSINGSVLAAVLMALAANTMARGTISVVTDATSVEVQFDDGFDPEAGDGIAGRAILYTTGNNVKGGARISSVDGNGLGDPIIGLTYAGAIQNVPQVGDTLILV
jgi:hypothetical protein